VPRITKKAFDTLRERFKINTGIDLSQDKHKFVETRLRTRVLARAHGSFNAYCDLLDRAEEGAERQLVIDLLTTNETYFFREPNHFAVLAQESKTRFAKVNLRVWSAACSTGEEPYSIAMTLCEHRPQLPWSVHASDISARVLEQARSGVFSPNRLEHMPQGYLERYCLRGREKYKGKIRVSDEVRSRVEFYQHNLLSGALPPSKFEIVFLRNVLIYFEQARKLDMLKNVLSALVPGGLLFVGHAEPLHALPLPLQRIHDAVFEKVV
jgi:chemotaxis protein methyltransferase CheR